MITTSTRRLVVYALVIAILLPFIGKPFHIDDPYWVWVAQQIQKHPFDPFGFLINWYGSLQSAKEIVQAPPLYSYLLALWGLFFGLSELSCHCLNFAFAVALVVGVERLASELECEPLVTTLATISPPLFLMSSTTVMADLSMLTFMTWAVFLWMLALRKNSAALFFTASIFAAATVLLKYNGAIVIALLFTTGLAAKRKQNFGWILIPVVTFALYLFWFHQKYGIDLMHQTAAYVSKASEGRSSLIARVVVLMTFVGGTTLGTMPFCWAYCRPRTLLLTFIAAVAIAAATSVRIQSTLFIWMSLMVFWVTVSEMSFHRDATSIFLGVWIGATIAFAGIFNWSVNGRSLITLVPPLALLAGRHWNRRGLAVDSRLFIFAAPAVLLSLIVGFADADMARVHRDIAQRLTQQFSSAAKNGHSLFFEGHWGFQWYMQQNGAEPLDYSQAKLKSGDALVAVKNNSNVAMQDFGDLAIANRFQVPYHWPVATMNGDLGAGYYSSVFGPSPYVIGVHPQETVYVWILK